ncbi:hypothetical protein MRX96_042166 [Rhipicephalus microplus]
MYGNAYRLSYNRRCDRGQCPGLRCAAKKKKEQRHLGDRSRERRRSAEWRVVVGLFISSRSNSAGAARGLHKWPRSHKCCDLLKQESIVRGPHLRLHYLVPPSTRALRHLFPSLHSTGAVRESGAFVRAPTCLFSGFRRETASERIARAGSAIGTKLGAAASSESPHSVRGWRG